MHSAATNISSQKHPDPAAMGGMKVIIAAGGTGGHVYPAIAIADEIQAGNPRAEILFVGTKDHMEWEAVPKAGYNITNIWISGFHRRLTLKNLFFPVKLLTSLAQSFSILSRFKPDVVVCCGGYAAGPVGWVASKKGIPLVVQEQNSYPGVTNRILGKSARKVFTAFEDANRYFPPGKTEVAGNPTRKSLEAADTKEAYSKFGFDEQKRTLLILGGSGGARSINEAMAEHIKTLHDEMGLQVIWQCGKRYYDKLQRDVQAENYDNLLLTDYIYDMPAAYAVADLVISRAGALSCSELALTAKPSILVPSPNVAGDHQTKNARSMVQENAAELVKDEELNLVLPEVVDRVINDRPQLEKMSKAARNLAKPDAARHIAKEVMNLIRDKAFK